MENSWRILSWGGIVPSPLADWQQPRGLIGKLWNQLWCLHMRRWWGERRQDTFKTAHSKTVISYVKGVEKKWFPYIWNITQRIPEDAKQRIQKWIGFGGACWHLCGEDRLAVSYPAFIDSLQNQSPLEGLCRDTDNCAIVEKAKQAKTVEREHRHPEVGVGAALRTAGSCHVAECRESQTALLCKCVYRFQLSDKANGHNIFFKLE